MEPDRMPIGHDLSMLLDAACIAARFDHVTAAQLQRRVRVGFVKAGRLVLLLEQEGLIVRTRVAGRFRSLIGPGELSAALERIREAAAKENADA